ncbi:MAG: 6-bladed beta-propeller [Balneolaceae bacterium]|nr:6-bladed beta-propeller [Balneolaceae bacterium]
MKKILNIFFLLVFWIASGCVSKQKEQVKVDSGNLASIDVPERLKDLNNLSAFTADTEPTYKIQLREDREYGTIYPALMPPTRGFGEETAVDGKGKVYRADKGEGTIRVYAPDGKELTNIGRRGRGPGEFEEITSIQIYKSQLMVYDSRSVRISIFNLDPVKLDQSISIDYQGQDIPEGALSLYPATFLRLNDGEFLTALRLQKEESTHHFGYYKADKDGNIKSDLIVKQQRKQTHSGRKTGGQLVGIVLPFSTHGIVKLSAEGSIYHVNTAEFLIQKYDADGTYQRAIYYPFNNDPLEESEVLAEFYHTLHSVVESADYPETWPAIHSMLIDDKERMWIATIIDDKEYHEWWVLAPLGKLLAKFVLSSGESIEAVRNDKIYTKSMDEDKGGEVVRSYRIDMQ